MIKAFHISVKKYKRYMNKKVEYLYHNRRNGLKWLWQGVIDKHLYRPYGKEYHYNTKRINSRPIMDKTTSYHEISRHILESKPFWLARYGHTEMRFINSVLYNKYGGKIITPENADIDSALAQFCNNAGFFPHNKGMGQKYVDMVLQAAPHIDIHAYWDLWMEGYMASAYEKTASFMYWRDFAPYYTRKEDDIMPWTHALKGKKVLVINPFVDSINKQYQTNRGRLFSKIFEADDILPEFDLRILKSVQTSGGNVDGRFKDWFEALDYMKEQIRSIEFDVALIGCGAYGYLLADYVKTIGKVAIQSCGCTQMLFGVLGKRWTEDEKLMTEVVNDYWIHPSDAERPAVFNNVEGGCYW